MRVMVFKRASEMISDFNRQDALIVAGLVVFSILGGVWAFLASYAFVLFVTCPISDVRKPGRLWVFSWGAASVIFGALIHAAYLRI